MACMLLPLPKGRLLKLHLLLFTLLAGVAAQDTRAALEGQIFDPSGAVVASASVTVRNTRNGLTLSQTTGPTGSYYFSLPAGEYDLTVSAPKFTGASRSGLTLQRCAGAPPRSHSLHQRRREVLEISDSAALIDAGSNAIGNVVTGRELLDLPLNGRNFTQLGLLQPGVAPMTAGLAEAGGSLRAGQAYAVNGQRPESNNYLLDGVSNVNRVDGGFALRTPVDAIQEFRILTLSAPAEYGGTGGATTTVVTRSGGNQVHGAVYEFLRNDIFDARNFFAADVEPLKQHQFGATLGGPLRRNRDFLFGYYEGFRNRQGVTRNANVPSDLQRQGDFSELSDPQSGNPIPLLNLFTGQPFPNNRIPAPAIHPMSQRILNFYPRPNAGRNLFLTTQTVRNRADQGGLRFDHIFGDRDQLNINYNRSSVSNEDPLSVSAPIVPRFPRQHHTGHRVGDPPLQWFHLEYLPRRLLPQRLLHQQPHQPDFASRTRLSIRQLP